MNDKSTAWESYLLKPGNRVRLNDSDPAATELCAKKKQARAKLKRYRREINAHLAVLAAEAERSLLVVLQGVDASGKDGAVRRVFTGVNPQHCRVVSFKEPSREELDHDYLWRVYRSAPVRGELCVFNRSQYEDVLVPRARGMLSPLQARSRLRQIADLERTWAENGTVIRKLFLHISREEQGRRFESRLDRPDKHWKVKDSDFADRKLWPKFQNIYQQILRRTSFEHAPWYMVPADHKWYRDLVVAGVVLEALRDMAPHLPMPQLDQARFHL